jgi:predicted house-cleaning noncanonical NTP pyrophosphatase (MazG superfamily)
MRKTLVIIGLVLSALLVQGVVFFLSSRVPAEEEESLPEVPPPGSTSVELLKMAEQFKEQFQFDLAGAYIRAALNEALTDGERAQAAHAMGLLLFEQHLQGEDVRAEAAASYLRAAYDDSKSDLRAQVQIGLDLLDVYDVLEETEQAQTFLDQMLSSASDPEDLLTLWRIRFNLLNKGRNNWREMNEALALAESLPLQSAAWAELIHETQLRSKEKLLADDTWLEAFLSAGIGGKDGPEKYRQRVFENIRTQLEEIIQKGNKQEQDEAYLRLANAMVLMGDYEKGQELLVEFISRDPTENLTDALLLLSRISRVLGEVDYAAELAHSMIQRFDFNAHTRTEILSVVELLEEHELYEEALALLQGCFSLMDQIGVEHASLISRATILEERLGHRQQAVAYLSQLKELDAEERLADTFTELIDLNMEQSQYESIEYWIGRFLGALNSRSDAYGNALFSLFEAKYWLDRPVLDQLFIGAAAIQNMPEDQRAASVELRMARYIESMQLNELAVSYYNRIGLLNFFQGDSEDAFSQNIGEQAMLGKARCLTKLEDWVAADHLYREICNRTQSPLVKSEAAVSWANLASRFGQNREALRRYDLAYEQMLSRADLVRYSLGRAKVEGENRFWDAASIEDSLRLLDDLPEKESRSMSISFFNEAFDSAYREKNQRAMERIIDLACQSDYADWLPVQSYVLRLYENQFQNDKLSGLGMALRTKDGVDGASTEELAQVVERLERVAESVKRHKKKAIQ